MVRIIYLFIGFTGIIVGLVSLSPWIALLAAKMRRQKGQ
jgi:uncharacterized membrane protein YuzA (DUF378 family)